MKADNTGPIGDTVEEDVTGGLKKGFKSTFILPLIFVIAAFSFIYLFTGEEIKKSEAEAEMQLMKRQVSSYAARTLRLKSRTIIRHLKIIKSELVQSGMETVPEDGPLISLLKQNYFIKEIYFREAPGSMKQASDIEVHFHWKRFNGELKLYSDIFIPAFNGHKATTVTCQLDLAAIVSHLEEISGLGVLIYGKENRPDGKYRLLNSSSAEIAKVASLISADYLESVEENYFQPRKDDSCICCIAFKSVFSDEKITGKLVLVKATKQGESCTQQRSNYNKVLISAVVAVLLLVIMMMMLTRHREKGILTVTERYMESEERFRRIFDETTESILLLEDGVFVDCNQATLRMLRMKSKEELLNTRPHEVSPVFQPDGMRSSEKEKHHIKDALENGSTNFEWKHIRKDGEEFWAEINLTHVKFRGRSMLHCVWKDIDQVKNYMNNIEEKERFQRMLLNTIQVGIVLIDDRTRNIELVNPAASEILKLKPEQLIGRSCSEFFGDCDNNGKGTTEESHLVLREGREIEIIKSSATLTVGGKEKILESFFDISEMKRVEEELRNSKLTLEIVNRRLKEQMEISRNMADEAEKANRAKGDFLAHMSHEIRTPMNGVIGMAGLLLDTKLNDEQKRYAEVVKSSGQSLLTLINDILDFSKIESGKLDFDVTSFDLTSLFENFVDTFALRVEEKHLELNWYIEPEIPKFLRGDPGRLRQILVNLIGNAIKFTSSGEISVEVKLIEETSDDIVLSFIIRDTGIGISEEYMSSLFSPFTQAHKTSAGKYGGTGLGLSISKQLVEMMGGSISVESTIGEGSVFQFTAVFDKADTSDSRLRADYSRDLERFRSLRILTVDDNATSRKVIGGYFKSWGFRHDEVDNGNIALAKLREAIAAGDPYDLIILDRIMPFMSGEKLCNVIRDDVDLKKMKIVMLSAYIRKGDPILEETDVYDGFIFKPVKGSTLYNAIVDAFEPGNRIVEDRDKPQSEEVEVRAGRILVAEDNITNRAVIVSLLKKLGYSSVPANNGKEALEELVKGGFDLVLMDCQMPEMDGYEATRNIRKGKDGINKDIPVIAVTANAMKGDREKCMDAGMNDYIAKPVNPEEIRDKLSRWISADKG